MSRQLRIDTRPRYIQIAHSLAKRIQSGELAIGDQLPSERQLSEELSVSRMTIRQALLTLREQGLVEGHHGRGYFVTEKRIEQPVDILVGFSDNLKRKGFQPGARVLELKKILADRETAQVLQLGLGEPVFFVHRLRLGDDLPMAIEHSYFPAHRCPNLQSHDLETRSIYSILSEEYGIRLGRARQSLEPTVARADEAELLNIQPGVPLMLIERISYDTEQNVVEYAKDLYRGDCFRFVSESESLRW